MVNKLQSYILKLINGTNLGYCINKRSFYFYKKYTIHTKSATSMSDASK